MDWSRVQTRHQWSLCRSPCLGAKIGHGALICRLVSIGPASAEALRCSPFELAQHAHRENDNPQLPFLPRRKWKKRENNLNILGRPQLKRFEFHCPAPS